jgi:hypothetical protein
MIRHDTTTRPPSLWRHNSMTRRRAGHLCHFSAHRLMTIISHQCVAGERLSCLLSEAPYRMGGPREDVDVIDDFWDDQGADIR